MGIQQLSYGETLITRLILFDVDMTLLWTRGAGTRAIGKADLSDNDAFMHLISTCGSPA